MSSGKSAISMVSAMACAAALLSGPSAEAAVGQDGLIVFYGVVVAASRTQR